MSEVNVQKSAGCNEIKINVKPVPVNPVVLGNSYIGIDYNVLKNKPQIEGNELIGNKTAKELLGFDKTDMDATVSVAQGAEEVANAGNAKAQDALDIANAAKETADGVDAKATKAMTDSADALAKATEAKNTADSYQGQITTIKNDVDDLGDQVATIESKIPAEATADNQLADKAFVTEKTDELAADIAALDADKADKATTLAGYGISDAYTKTATDNAIKAIQLIKWVETLPTTGDTKYLYAIPREETDKEGKKIVALYLWDGNEWRGQGGTSIDTSNLVTTNTSQSITAQKYFTVSPKVAGLVTYGNQTIVYIDPYGYGKTRFGACSSASPSTYLQSRDTPKIVRYVDGAGVKEYKNIDSGNISEYLSTDNNGIKGDYCTSYGILEAPNGILTNPSGMQVTLKQGVVMQLAGQDIKTTMSGDMTQTLTSTSDCDLFYVSGTTSLMEVAQIVWSTTEPDNGATGVLAWWNPANASKKWKFKSNDTGNVWAEAVATPVAHIHTNGTTITRIDHIGYRVMDDEIYALKSDVGGTKRPLGEVYFSQSDLASDNPGALPGWTGEYYENASTLYPDFYTWVKSHTERCKTKAQYDEAISAYGECQYYVVDEVEGSLRLPKYASNKRQLVKKEANGNDWYALYSDGWLEQGGYFGNPSTVGESAITETFWKSYATPPTVLFGNMSAAKNVAYDFENYPYDVTENGFTHKNTMPNGQGTRWYAFGYAANTPMENIMYPWIVSFTAAVPASTAQAAEFTGALSGKANTDLSNVLANIDYVVESKLPTADDPTWYRKYKSGWVEQGGTVTAAGTITLLKPFANTAYSVQATCLYTSYTNWGVGINKTSGASFSLNMNIGSQGAMWEAKGCAAE